MFICFIEFFASVSFLKEDKWKEVLKLVCEKNLEEEFVCAVYFFFEFFVSKNVHSNCEFCDSILILSLLSLSESIVSSAVFSILQDFASEDRSSSASFFSVKREKSKAVKKVVFTSCSSICFFFTSSVESLFALVFFVFESVEWSSAVLSSRKSEIVQREEIEFLDEKIVIESDVSNFCETSNSSFSSLNEFCVEAVEIEKEKKKRRNSFCFKFFAIDFALNCFHVSEIENLWSVVAIIEKV
jgi:hypothetical protein